MQKLAFQPVSEEKEYQGHTKKKKNIFILKVFLKKIYGFIKQKKVVLQSGRRVNRRMTATLGLGIWLLRPMVGVKHEGG